MIRLMLAAPRSGSGKTVVTCAILRSMARRGLAPCAFKVGPDYLDPTFHRAVLGVESRNLDLFLSDEACVRAIFARGCQNHGAAVIEGVMGYYDGLGGTSERASAWHVAQTLDVPTILVLPARGASLSLAAEIRGFRAFREDSRIAGVVLNECSAALYRTLVPALEREGGVPVLGFLPKIEAARFDSRHLGLHAAGEIADLSDRLDALADALVLDWERLTALCDAPAPPAPPTARHGGVPVAVAEDEAFFFTYRETLDALREQGVEVVPFSPLHDAALPEGVCALYLPGGYPELYAKALADNASMRESVKSAVLGGLPTVVECGGFLYLGASLCDPTGAAYPMAGVLPGRAADAGRLVRFGYATLCAEDDSMLFRAGERVPVHEFHHWDSDANGAAFRMEKPLTGKAWRGGFASPTLYAALPHLYFAGNPALAARFAAAARTYGEKYGLI